jgi:hypothetical protein
MIEFGNDHYNSKAGMAQPAAHGDPPDLRIVMADQLWYDNVMKNDHFD